MKKENLILLAIFFLACNDNISSKRKSVDEDEKCMCSNGTTVIAGDVVCIEERRWKCVLDDETKRYELKPTAENCDEEDIKCEAPTTSN